MKNCVELLDLAFGALAIPAPEDFVKDKAWVDLESKEMVEKYGGRHWKGSSPDDLALQVGYSLVLVTCRFFVASTRVPQSGGSVV